MAAPTPVGITRTPERELRIEWNDGHVVRLSLQLLRDECPCAGCKGETGLLGKHYAPMDLPILKPGTYDLAAVTAVGNYAIAISWGDGHDTGIYSWEYLLALEQRL